MAYNKKNFLEKRAAAVRLANAYYEPGRQDRCYRRVWQKHIHPLYHIQYKTFMMWVSAEKKNDPGSFPSKLF